MLSDFPEKLHLFTFLQVVPECQISVMVAILERDPMGRGL
jgi:hypothetical protein